MSTIDKLLATLKTDAQVRQVVVGTFWTAVVLDTDPPRCGLASVILGGHQDHNGPAVPHAGRLLESSARELAEGLRSFRPIDAGIGMAAFNALIDVDEASCVEINARDIIVERAASRRVAIVGHFPFVTDSKRSRALLGARAGHETG